MKLKTFPFLALLLYSNLLAAQSVTLFDRIQIAIQNRNEKAYMDLVSEEAKENEQQFLKAFFSFPYKRAVLKIAQQREDRLLLQVFLEADDESRYESWMIKTVQVNGQSLIGERRVISTISGLYRLRMNQDSIRVQNYQFRHLDAAFRFQQGELFMLTAGGEPAGAVFLGDGTLEFAPRDRTEQHQLALFCKQPRLQSRISQFYIRASTGTLKKLFGPLLENQNRGNSGLFQRAADIARVANVSAFNVTIPLTEELWFPRVELNDLYTEMKSSLGTLVYQFASGEPEDVLLAQKEKDRIVCLYSYAKNKSDPSEQYSITEYKMRVAVNPQSNYLLADADVRLKSTDQTSTIIFKLNPSLRVSQIDSSQGPLIYFQEKKTSNLHVVLNEPLEGGQEISFQFSYQGRIEPEKGRMESQTTRIMRQDQPEIHVPQSLLYSNQSLWYPQLPEKSYTTVDATITVPEGYIAISNGQLQKKESNPDRTVFFYKCDTPLRYFSMLVSRIEDSLTYNSIVPVTIFYQNIDKKQAIQTAQTADKILKYYSGYFGKYPYKNLTIVLRPLEEYGGHSPATIAIINRVFTFYHVKMRRDPLLIPDFPAFILAHEIAHQWWGQAVGWRDYRDQWLSEGFAQFAAVEFTRSQYGEEGWHKLSGIFEDWIDSKSYAGPLTLGARLGHLTNDPQAFSAILYDKGAYVLNMLKIWLGREAFKKCVSDFYSSYEFKLARLQDFATVAQRYSKEDLQPFFNEWLNDWNRPSLTWKIGKFDSKEFQVEFSQPSSNFYTLKVPVIARSGDGHTEQLIAYVDEASKTVKLTASFVPSSVEVDPTHEILLKRK